jgi:hypothetical protein
MIADAEPRGLVVQTNNNGIMIVKLLVHGRKVIKSWLLQVKQEAQNRFW